MKTTSGKTATEVALEMRRDLKADPSAIGQIEIMRNQDYHELLTTGLAFCYLVLNLNPIQAMCQTFPKLDHEFVRLPKAPSLVGLEKVWNTSTHYHRIGREVQSHIVAAFQIQEMIDDIELVILTHSANRARRMA